KFRQKDKLIEDLTEKLNSAAKQIRDLEKQAALVQEQLEKQGQIFNQTLEQKELEYKQKAKKITNSYEEKVGEFEKNYEQKLMEKYKQLEAALKDKETNYDKELLAREKEFATLKEQLESSVKMLRQLLAQKELEFNQAFAREKDEAGKKNEVLQKSAEQLKIYVAKIKEELRLKDSAISERDNKIAALNSKISLFSGEDISYKKKIDALMQEEIEGFKREKKRLEDALEKVENNFKKQEAEYLVKLQEKENALNKAERQLQIDVADNNLAWKDKMKRAEEKYAEKLNELQNNTEFLEGQYQLQVLRLAGQVEKKEQENAELKKKLQAYYNNRPMELLEELRAEKMERKRDTRSEPVIAALDFKGQQQERAKMHFEKAMDAIVKKNYLKAKNELEQLLLIEPDSKLAINTMGRLNILMDREQ
ncbi:MAG: hypothetical protein ABII75_02985, partial [Candidatus Omnitrophota bacterium]